MQPTAGEPGGGTVMLCFDGSAESANAIARAGELLRNRRALVVNVWTGLSAIMLYGPLSGAPMGPLFEGASMIDEHDLELSEQTAARGAALAEAAGFDARSESVAQRRNAWWTLRDHALKRDISTIVVGARGRSRVASMMLGSVSSGLVHHAPVPVLVIPPTATAKGAGPIMFCDDGSSDARLALGRGRLLLGGAGLVVSLWRSFATNVPYMVSGPKTVVGTALEVDRATEKQSRRTAASGAEAAGGTSDGDCASSDIRFEGPSWRGLIETANDRDAAAIVVGSRGLTGIIGSLGSVSGAIAQHSPRPVLVVPGASETAALALP